MDGHDGAEASKPLLNPYDSPKPNEEDLNHPQQRRQGSKSSNPYDKRDNRESIPRARQSSRSTNPFEQPGSRFSADTFDAQSRNSSRSNNPFEQPKSTQGSIHTRNSESRRQTSRSMDARSILASTAAYHYPSTSRDSGSAPRSSSSPRTSKQERDFVTDCGPNGPSSGKKPYPPIVGENRTDTGRRTHRKRASSLGQRFPGDVSHRPLDIIRKEVKTADRAPHLKRHHIPGADLIDSLDDTMGSLYHHEGPYDATLRSRNNMTKKEYNPVEALKESNEEALRATPREHIQDSLRKHIPLQGVASVPPGGREMSGELMMYKEGDDMMRDAYAPGGAYKRYEGVTYLPGDLKGKGEPGFSIDEAAKRGKSRSTEAETAYEYEMQPTSRARRHTFLTPNRPRPARATSGDGREYVAGKDMTAIASGSSSNAMSYADYEKDLRRSNTTGGKLGGLKRRLGSLRRSKKTDSQVDGVSA